MLRAMLVDPATGGFRQGDVRLVEDWQDEAEAVVWVDLHEEPPEAESELLQRCFGLHPLAIQDAQRLRHPPKIEAFDTFTFLLLKGLGAAAEEIHDLHTIQIAIFIGPRFLVTRHSGDSKSIDALWARAAADPGILGRGPDRAAIGLCQVIVDRYRPLLLDVEARVDELEDEMLTRPSDDHLRELVSIQSNLKKLRRMMVYHVQVFRTLDRGGLPAIGEDLEHEITDVHEQLDRAHGLADLYAEVASDLMNGYLSLASHRLNHVMKVLTIVTAVFVPLGFLAGVYGMNFEYMPELKWRYAYFTLLGIMASIAAGLLLLFRRKGWLQPS